MSIENEKKEFLEKIAESNSDWVAQQLLMRASVEQITEWQKTFAQVEAFLSKGWNKDMTFIEISDSVSAAAYFLDIPPVKKSDYEY